MEGILRYLDTNIALKVEETMRALAVMIGKKYKTAIVIKNQSEYPMVVNSAKLCKSLKNIHPSIREYPIERMGADDFSEFSSIGPGCYFMYFIGAQEGHSLHCDNLDFNDQCIEPAFELCFRIICERLNLVVANGKDKEKDVKRKYSLYDEEVCSKIVIN